MVDRLSIAGRLFRTHITQRAQQVARLCQIAVGTHLRKSEVSHPNVAVAVQHQIGRLDVAMDDPQLVSVSQSLSGLANPFGNDAEKAVRVT